METTSTRPYLHPARWAVVLGTMALAVLAWAVAVQAVGDVVVDQAGTERTVGQLSVVLTSLGAGFAAWASLTVLERLTRRAHGVWLGLAAVVLLLSFAGPVSATTDTGVAVLLGLHVLVGLSLVGGLLVLAPRLAAAVARRQGIPRVREVR